jgi:hypothetical protein
LELLVPGSLRFFGFLRLKLVFYISKNSTPPNKPFFNRMQIPSSIALALSHGANDVQESIGFVVMSFVILRIFPEFHCRRLRQTRAREIHSPALSSFSNWGISRRNCEVTIAYITSPGHIPGVLQNHLHPALGLCRPYWEYGPVSAVAPRRIATWN